VIAPNQESLLKQTITALKYQSSQPGGVVIYLDGQKSAVVNPVTAANFKVGDRIDQDTVAKLLASQQRGDAYRCALRLLGRRDHSTLEIKQKLSRREFDPDVIDDTLNRLIDKKYLDDQAFAVHWVNQRAHTAPRSRRLMRQELRHKGVGRAQIEMALADVDEHALAMACLQRKRRRWRRLKESARHLKLLAYLSRKGFSYAIARAAAESYHDDAD
jgi:regulatory protein